jgi:DNA-binding beta-propeller fold protein YncE
MTPVVRPSFLVGILIAASCYDGARKLPSSWGTAVRRHLFSSVFLTFLGMSLRLTVIMTPPLAAGQSAGLRAPAGDRPVSIVPGGETVLPSGRLITPLGNCVKLAPHPFGLTLSPDGKTLVTANSGTQPFSVSIITNLQSREPQVAQIPPGFKSSDTDPESVFLGVAVAPDNRTLYVSEGNNGRVGIFDLITQQRLYSLSIDGNFQGTLYQNSLAGSMQLTPDGRYLLVLDIAHFRLVIVDTKARQIVASCPVGRMPFGLALSPGGSRAYVSNVGMFQYSLVPGYDNKDARDTGLDFPPFGFPSQDAKQGATVQGKQIPGLGDPNVPESNSVFVVDILDPMHPRVIARIGTGLPVGPQSVGGSSPGAVVAGHKKAFVSNATQDSITIIDARSMRVNKTITLEPAQSVRGLRGVLPFGMALSPNEKWLYVACSGINAVAVIDARRDKVLGYIPTAWFPARVAVSPTGKTLYVSNAKGFGAGPNGGPNFHQGPEGTYIGDITKGVISIVSLPITFTESYELGHATGPPDTWNEEWRAHPKFPAKIYRDKLALAKNTQQVLANNGFIQVTDATLRKADSPIPPPGQPSRMIKHVVFIVKENRTFDEVFGDLDIAGSHIEADPSLARWGEGAQVREEGQPTVEFAHVTPNHHALARRFAFGDNYYVDSDVSVDGHHWLVGTYPNELVEAGWPAAYGGQLDFRADPDAPGRLGIGSTGPWPESYLQAGSLWEQLARHGVSFRNYGEGLEMAGDDEGTGLMPTGVREAVNIPMPNVLFENTSRSYATFNTNISDQYRFDQFQREFELRYVSGKELLPQFIYIWLPNDHTAKPRPEDGYAYHASYVADNDLALGKLVELFSNSPFWKDMAIFVTEDDAQDGRDHVDAHRSLLMVISPYARRGVSHVHTSMASILKTFDLIFGMPYLNQYDAAATDLSDMFTDQPDFTPYQAVPSDKRIFDPAKVREPGLDLRARPGAPLDDPGTIRREMRKRLKEGDDD